MSGKNVRISLAVLSGLLLPLLGACSSQDVERGKTGKEETAVRIESLSIEKSKKILVGMTVKFAPVVKPMLKVGPALVWKSSNPRVAKVDELGNVTGLEPGEADVSVHVLHQDNVQASSHVVVMPVPGHENPEFPDPFFVAGIKFTYDTNGDGYLDQKELDAVKYLDVSSSRIRSLQGIEHLRNLEHIDCSANRIENVDFSKNPKLRYVDASFNPISRIDVRKLAKLDTLKLENTRLRTLDLTETPSLSFLCIKGNNGNGSDRDDGITSLDLSHNPKLRTLLASEMNVLRWDFSHNPDLEHLELQFAGFERRRFHPLRTLDLSHNPRLRYLDCRGWNDGDGLRELDLSANGELRELNCGMNVIERLDLSHCPRLESLTVAHNRLRTLDVAGLSRLKVLYCDFNAITGLELGDATSLEFLRCADNKIASLDLHKTRVYYVDAARNGMRSFRLGSKVFDTPDDKGEPYLYLNLSSNRLQKVDVAGQKHLHALNVDGNFLGSLDVSGCDELHILEASNNGISRLQLGSTSGLWTLHLANNNLKGDLDVSLHKGLHFGSFQNNELRSVKVAPTVKLDDETYVEGRTEKCFTKDASTKWIQ